MTLKKKPTAKTHYIKLVVSYKSAGGMGEHDAIEEGLRGIIENRSRGKFDVKELRGLKRKPRWG
jgi:hypothetical protein